MFNISKLQNNPTELILTTAKEIIYEEGISNVSMRKIALKCNIGVGTIYNYYPTKMDIIVAVIEEFWRNCLMNFNIIYVQNVDFFKEIELFYFHVLDYQKQFQGNFLKDLTSLPATNRIRGKERESEFIVKLLGVFEDMFYKHENEFNAITFDYISKDEIIQYILDYFFVMLRRNETDIKFFVYSLKKLLL